MSLGPTRIQLILSYITLYNAYVSATATLCRQNVTHFIGLHYGTEVNQFQICYDLPRDVAL